MIYSPDLHCFKSSGKAERDKSAGKQSCSFMVTCRLRKARIWAAIVLMLKPLPLTDLNWSCFDSFVYKYMPMEFSYWCYFVSYFPGTRLYHLSNICALSVNIKLRHKRNENFIFIFISDTFHIILIDFVNNISIVIPKISKVYMQ